MRLIVSGGCLVVAGITTLVIQRYRIDEWDRSEGVTARMAAWQSHRYSAPALPWLRFAKVLAVCGAMSAVLWP